MRTFLVIAVFSIFFSLAPTALAGTITAGGGCANGTSDCVSGLVCVNEMCVDPANQQPANTARDSVSPRNTGQNVTLINPLNTGECAPNENCLLNFLNKILDFVIRIGTVIIILMLVYVGYLFVAARGNDTKITEARNALLWTVVGALILLGSQAIAKGIEATVRALSAGG